MLVRMGNIYRILKHINALLMAFEVPHGCRLHIHTICSGLSARGEDLGFQLFFGRMHFRMQCADIAALGLLLLKEGRHSGGEPG